MKPWLGEEEAAAASDAIRSGWVAQGPRVAQFEAGICEFTGARHGVAVSSCTAGLHLALHALGVGPGDEVVVPSLSFIASANAPGYVGARAVFADVERSSMNLTAETIEPVLGPATKAVIVVHQVGMPADLVPIRALCESRGIALVEDAACALGSLYQGEPIGHNPALAVFSFHARKLLTTGEGGMIVTKDPELAERLVRLRQHGVETGAWEREARARPDLERYAEAGFNFRMTDIQAAVGLVQLRKLPAMVARRRELAACYRERLAGLPGLELPEEPPRRTANYQSYSVFLDSAFPLGRDALLQRLTERGISARRGIIAAHLEPAFAGHGHAPLPVTEQLTSHSILLPLFHEMTEELQDRVVKGLERAVASTRRTA